MWVKSIILVVVFKDFRSEIYLIMACSSGFVQYIVEQCSGSGEITVRKMMGDYCIYCDGTIFGLIYDNNFYVKVMAPGKYKRAWFKTTLTVSFQFHHTQMDGAHASRFLDYIQQEIGKMNLKKDAIGFATSEKNITFAESF